jgi:hypothetical protein
LEDLIRWGEPVRLPQKFDIRNSMFNIRPSPSVTPHYFDLSDSSNLSDPSPFLLTPQPKPDM